MPFSSPGFSIGLGLLSSRQHWATYFFYFSVNSDVDFD